MMIRPFSHSRDPGLVQLRATTAIGGFCDESPIHFMLTKTGDIWVSCCSPPLYEVDRCLLVPETLPRSRRYTRAGSVCSGERTASRALLSIWTMDLNLQNSFNLVMTCECPRGDHPAMLNETFHFIGPALASRYTQHYPMPISHGITKRPKSSCIQSA